MDSCERKRARFCIPYFFSIIDDRAIAGKPSRGGDIDHRLTIPGIRVRVQRARLLLCLGIRCLNVSRSQEFGRTTPHHRICDMMAPIIPSLACQCVLFVVLARTAGLRQPRGGAFTHLPFWRHVKIPLSSTGRRSRLPKTTRRRRNPFRTSGSAGSTIRALHRYDAFRSLPGAQVNSYRLFMKSAIPGHALTVMSLPCQTGRHGTRTIG